MKRQADPFDVFSFFSGDDCMVLRRRRRIGTTRVSLLLRRFRESFFFAFIARNRLCPFVPIRSSPPRECLYSLADVLRVRSMAEVFFFQDAP